MNAKGKHESIQIFPSPERDGEEGKGGEEILFHLGREEGKGLG